MITKNGLTHHIIQKIEDKELETEEDWNTSVFKKEDDIKQYLSQFKYEKS